MKIQDSQSCLNRQCVMTSVARTQAFSVEEMERQYTPSLFSKRFSTRDELLKHFLSITTNGSEKSRINYDCHLNIAYGATKREKLDIYGDDLPKSAPLFIFIHGGYWQMLDKEQSSFMVGPFYEHGIRTLTIDYDICPNVSLEMLIEQIKKCFKWVGNYISENNIKKVGIFGHSAGAHLLNYAINEEFMSTITASVEVHAFYTSGIYYVEELRYLKAANENDILGITDDNCRLLSPIYMDFTYLKNYNFFAYVYAGEYESDMFRTHSKKFADGPIREFLKEFKICENLDHFDIIEKLSENDYEITQIIIKSLKD